MLAEIYIEALLVDDVLADQVWEAWDKGLINDWLAAWAWWQLTSPRLSPYSEDRRKSYASLMYWKT